MKLVLLAICVLLFSATFVGATTAAVATAPRDPPAKQLFAWVPEEGFPDAFPYGQCTWWAAYNRHVTWGGNARDWLENAKAQGVATSDYPSAGAIVSPRRSRDGARPAATMTPRWAKCGTAGSATSTDGLATARATRHRLPHRNPGLPRPRFCPQPRCNAIAAALRI